MTRELIDGFITMMSPRPRWIHQAVAASLSAELGLLRKKSKGVFKVLPEIDVRIPKNGEKNDNEITTNVIPDISIVIDKSKLDDKGCLGAPEMIVEIQSPTTSVYDVTKKLKLYESSGVKEYWVVYPNDKCIRVFILDSDGMYDDGILYETGSIPVHVLNNAEIQLNDIFI
jgi:Uma2 family endonuclease